MKTKKTKAMFTIPYRGVPNYLTLAFFSTVVLWTVIAYYNTLIVEVGCTKMAEISSNIASPKVNDKHVYSFERVKYDCVAETAPQGKAFLALYAMVNSKPGSSLNIF